MHNVATAQGVVYGDCRACDVEKLQEMRVCPSVVRVRAVTALVSAVSTAIVRMRAADERSAVKRSAADVAGCGVVRQMPRHDNGVRVQNQLLIVHADDSERRYLRNSSADYACFVGNQGLKATFDAVWFLVHIIASVFGFV